MAVKDLTRGSVIKHILVMAAPVAVSMICTIAYQLIDLYFVAEIGPAAVAGVNAAGSAGLLIFALTQVLGAGTVATIAQALGRRDREDVRLVFNQAIALSAICGVVTLVLSAALIYPYLKVVSADRSTLAAGIEFTVWVLPAFVAFPLMTVLSSALRGAGIVRPATALYMITITINAVLAPVLIAGWGTQVPLGVQGAGMATSVSVVIGTVMMGIYTHRSQSYLRMSRRLLVPRPEQWRRILAIGFPAGGEVVLMFLLPLVILYVVRDFGAPAQAGYSIGLRITQTILVPGMAISFAVAPLVGQNFGAANSARVIEVFRKAVVLGSATMLATTCLVYAGSKVLVGMFNGTASTIDVAVIFLEVTSLAFVAQGLVYTSSGMFQGDLVPGLLGSLELD